PRPVSGPVSENQGAQFRFCLPAGSGWGSVMPADGARSQGREKRGKEKGSEGVLDSLADTVRKGHRSWPIPRRVNRPWASVVAAKWLARTPGACSRWVRDPGAWYCSSLSFDHTRQNSFRVSSLPVARSVTRTCAPPTDLPSRSTIRPRIGTSLG